MKNNTFESLNGTGLKIAVVQARFNQDITDGLAKGAVQALKETGVTPEDIKIFQVPGSFEVPLFCQKIAEKNVFDGIAAIGAVIKGETAHFDYIAKAAAEGILKVMLEENIPIAFGIITVYNKEQAEKRAGNNKDNKGYEAALSLIEMIIKSKELNG